jgi:hypothetical protein
LKAARITRTTKAKIRIMCDPTHRRPGDSEIHSLFASEVGVIVRDKCPMLAPSWKKLSDELKAPVLELLSVSIVRSIQKFISDYF